MREELKKFMNKKEFHIGILIFIVFVVLIIVGFMILRYSVEGETNMPFKLSKISIISSAEGKDKEETVEGNAWNFDINQNNDIYLYVEKNEEYNKTETIKEVKIENITATTESKKGELKVYKPDVGNSNIIFSNKPENEIQNLTYTASENADMKNLKITNQSGVIAIRLANEKLAEYVSNEEQINHNELLKKADVAYEDIKVTIEFELIIVLDSNKQYKTTISLELPLEEVIEKGTTSKEFTDMEKYIFKRQYF